MPGLRWPRCSGSGETDWTLSALQTAAASLTGPEHLAAGRDRAGGGTGGAGGARAPGPGSRRWRPGRSAAGRPKVDSISFSVEVCSNGPWWTTRAGARLDTTMAGTRKPSWRVVGDQLAVGRRGAVAGVVDGGRVGVVDDVRRRHVVVEAAPLVEGDHEHGVVQVAGVGQRVVGVGDEPLAEPDVGQRVVVGRGAVALGVERRVDEADVRQVPGGDGVDERRRGQRDARRRRCRRSANGCQNGRYLVPHSARNGRSRKK